MNVLTIPGEFMMPFLSFYFWAGMHTQMILYVMKCFKEIYLGLLVYGRPWMLNLLLQDSLFDELP